MNTVQSLENPIAEALQYALSIQDEHAFYAVAIMHAAVKFKVDYSQLRNEFRKVVRIPIMGILG